MKKIIIATSIALALASSSAFAVTQQSGIYIGALGGWSFADAPSASDVGASSSSNRNYTWGGNLGYQYAFNQNWAAGIEIGYVDFGQTNYSGSRSGNIQTTGAQAMAVGSYMMNNGFNAFVKAGGIDEYTKVNNNITSPATGGNTKVAEWIPAAAVGVGYMPMQNFNVALQYEYTWGSNWDVSNNQKVSNPMTQNAVTLNLTYIIPLSF